MPIDKDVFRKAAADASVELTAKAAATLAQFNLDPDDPQVAASAAAGAVFVANIAQWATRAGLPPETASAVETLAGQAVEAFMALLPIE